MANKTSMAEAEKRVLDTLAQFGPRNFAWLHNWTHLTRAQLRLVLSTLESDGAAHPLGKPVIWHFGTAPLVRSINLDARDFDIDDSKPGPNGGRIVRFGDRHRIGHGQTSKSGPRGASSLWNLYG